jgi:prenyltransferase beta subunit
MDAFLNSLSRFLHRLLDVAEGPSASTQVLLAVLSAGLGVLTVTLIVMMYSRWGQMHVLRKCLILSLLAHLLLGITAATVRIHQYTSPRPEVIEVAINDASLEPKRLSPDADKTNADQAQGMTSAEPVKPWEPSPQRMPGRPAGDQAARPNLPDTLQPKKTVVSEASGLPGVGSPEQLPLAAAAVPQPEPLQTVISVPRPAAAKTAEPIQAAKASRREGVQTQMPGQRQFRPGLPAGASGPTVARGGHVGSPNSLLDRSLPLPTLADVRPTLGNGPGDSLPGSVDSQPSRGPSRMAAAYLPEASPGVRGPTVPGEPGTNEPGGSGGGTPGFSPDIPTGPVGGPEMTAAAPSGPPTIGVEGGTGNGAGSPWASGGSGIGVALPSRGRGFPDRDIPGIYKGRVAPDRSSLAQRQGATEQTEKAVRAALAFLAQCQESDGRFDASLHEAGREMRIAGRDRQSAGGKSDTGMTGLALLAFLASGHTHLHGDYSANVRRGLEYLMRKQRADGGLGGNGIVYEYMYCHAMAAFAMGEAYGMTGDERLEPFVRKAVGFTLAMQNKETGGWRYTTGDPGDTSQLGWQLMALKSAELAGIPIPNESRQGVLRFLNGVSYGNRGGLASYRTGETPTRTMTAEALVCRQFLGVSSDTPAAREAAEYLLGEMPGQGKDNVYYWYYGTLAMHQLQGPSWDRWNASLQRALVATQNTSGPNAGSWDPDGLWGTYGGRLYNTTLSTLCLEVYYRFLPMYVHDSSADAPAK